MKKIAILLTLLLSTAVMADQRDLPATPPAAHYLNWFEKLKDVIILPEELDYADEARGVLFAQSEMLVNEQKAALAIMLSSCQGNSLFNAYSRFLGVRTPVHTKQYCLNELQNLSTYLLEEQKPFYIKSQGPNSRGAVAVDKAANLISQVIDEENKSLDKANVLHEGVERGGIIQQVPDQL